MTLSPNDPGTEALPFQPDERQVFAARMRATRPIVTCVVLVSLVLVFALEMRWGGADSNAVLERMGAMSRSRLLAGEAWRLMSSGVLHGGGMHLALNAYVLWVLGQGTERLLGSARFLILYVASALVAALGSAVFLGELSVGASGAIWGLLGAQAVFAFRAPGYVPSSARTALQKGAATNLALNVVVSFMPHVDWAAHFAGGITGAALVASGLLMRGLPRLSDPDPAPGGRRRVRRIAAGFAALYAGGAVFGILAGRAWELQRPLEYVERALPELDATASVPTLVGKGEVEHASGQTIYKFGDEAGPILVAIQRVSLDPGELAAGIDVQLATLRREMSVVDEGLELVSAPRTEEQDGRLVTAARFRYSWGAVYDVAGLIEPPHGWRVEVLIWPDYTQRYVGAAQHIAASLKTASGKR